MKSRVWLWLLIGALPLPIYPFVLMADVMSLAAESPQGPVTFALRATSLGFLLTSIAYPVVYYMRGSRDHGKEHASATRGADVFRAVIQFGDHRRVVCRLVGRWRLMFGVTAPPA